MSGSMITIAAADGGSFKGYLATPESGSGPGLLLLQEIFGVNEHIRELADLYAQEGYLVLALDLFWRMKPGVELGYGEADLKTAFSFYQRFDIDQAILDTGDALRTLRANPKCTGKVAALGFCLGGKLAYLAAARLPIDAAVAYYGVAIEENLAEGKSVACPITLHFAAEDKFVTADARTAIKQALASNDQAEIYVYQGADHAFNNHHRETYHRPSASLAHSRTIGLLRRAIGPRYDLDALWEKHWEGEFVTLDADATIRTMVPQAYVNHVPSMIGGFGQEQLTAITIPLPSPTRAPHDSRFANYRWRSIGGRIRGLLQTRQRERHLAAGIKPTGKEVRIPMVAIVQFRGDKLYKEHLYWDQASVLAQ